MTQRQATATRIPVLTRTATDLEQERFRYESRRRGAALLLVYLVVLGIVAWSVLSR